MTFGWAMRIIFLNLTRIDLANSHIIKNDYKISLWIRPLNKSQARVELPMGLCGVTARAHELFRFREPHIQSLVNSACIVTKQL